VHSTMSENTDVSAVAADALHGAVDNASDLPASTSAPSDRYVSAPRRLFNRDKSVHQLLGGGQVADVLLWRQKYLSISILVGSTVIWFLLEKSQYTLVALLSNILFFTVIILFVWANLAALLNRFASWFVQSQGHSKVKVLQYVTDMFLGIFFFRNWPSSITTAGMLLSMSGTAQCDVLYISVLRFIPHAIDKLIPFCLTGLALLCTI
jgi:hypothetical protein